MNWASLSRGFRERVARNRRQGAPLRATSCLFPPDCAVAGPGIAGSRAFIGSGGLYASIDIVAGGLETTEIVGASSRLALFSARAPANTNGR